MKQLRKPSLWARLCTYFVANVARPWREFLKSLRLFNRDSQAKHEALFDKLAKSAPTIRRPDLPRGGAVRMLQAARRRYALRLKAEHPCHAPWAKGAPHQLGMDNVAFNRRARRALAGKVKFA